VARGGGHPRLEQFAAAVSSREAVRMAFRLVRPAAASLSDLVMNPAGHGV
jgi:hypothetical protein